MSRTINFYNIAIYRNGEKTNLEILDLIDKIALNPWEDLVRKINNEITAMFPLYLNASFPDKRIIPFGKFRTNYKPFVGHITTSDFKAIQNDIVEMVTMVFDKKYLTAIVDFNMYGIKPKGIEEYLTSFLRKSEDENWEIKLTPVYSKKGKDDIDKSQQIRYIELKLKVDKYTENIMKKSTRTNPDQILDMFDGIKETNEGLNADTIKIEFYTGQGSKATMDVSGVKALLNSLNIEHHSIESLKVRYRDTKTDQLNTIDLKNIDQQYRSKILKGDSNKNPAPEYIGNKILEVYKQFEGTLLLSYRAFLSDMEISSEYGMQNTPRDENKVEVKKS